MNVIKEKVLVSEVEELLKATRKGSKYEYVARTQFPQLYQRILSATKFLDDAYGQSIKFGVRLACILNGISSVPKCANPKCDKLIDLSKCKPSHQVPRHCCPRCSGEDPNTLLTRKETKTRVYGSPGWNNQTKAKETIAKDKTFYAKRNKKTRATKLLRHGSETFVNVAECKKTKLKNHGDENFNNRAKAAETNAKKTPEQKRAEVEKRLETRRRHLQEDPSLKDRALQKSIAMRKKNHGEDYTGRSKCWKTCRENYGVDNPWQIESVKDNIKKHNLETYGVEYYSSTKECREKVASTCMKEYGSPCYFGSEEGKSKLKQKNLEEHGVEHTWQREDVKEHIRATNRDLYGVDYPAQNPDIRRQWQKRYTFEGIAFDSAPELAFYIWLRDAGVEFEYQPNTSFSYEFAGKTSKYEPDFRVGDMFFELKGDHFFSEDGKMINPYDRSQDALYEAKHQCMLANNVTILRSGEYTMFLDYVAKKYGESYLKSFKNTRPNGK